jgi:hypothetical protein
LTKRQARPGHCLLPTPLTFRWSSSWLCFNSQWGTTVPLFTLLNLLSVKCQFLWLYI